MKNVGIYDAKTNLPKLLKEVEAGEVEYEITNNNRPVAWLIPVPGYQQFSPRTVIGEIRHLRTWTRQDIHQGRR